MYGIDSDLDDAQFLEEVQYADEGIEIMLLNEENSGSMFDSE